LPEMLAQIEFFRPEPQRAQGLQLPFHALAAFRRIESVAGVGDDQRLALFPGQLRQPLRAIAQAEGGEVEPQGSSSTQR
jgi:hypothetical protein